MPNAINTTLSEFQTLLEQTPMPPDMRLTVTFEDDDAANVLLRRKNVIDAMNKLRGTGNGNLVSALLRARKADEAR